MINIKILFEYLAGIPIYGNDCEYAKECVLRGEEMYLLMGNLVMDSASKVQMDYICLQYLGHFSLGKWMERLAQSIADGVIKVPKDH
jgi:hypothetical protein